MKIYMNLVKLHEEETPNKYVPEEQEGPEYSCSLLTNIYFATWENAIAMKN